MAAARTSLEDDKAEKAVTADTRTSLALTRRWLVKDVSPTGVATLEMTITELKRDIRQPDGTTLTIDSANPDDAKGMADYLNRPVVVVVVDPQGRLVEVKEAKGGSASRLHAELPFRVVLPDAAVPLLVQLSLVVNAVMVRPNRVQAFSSNTVCVSPAV